MSHITIDSCTHSCSTHAHTQTPVCEHTEKRDSVGGGLWSLCILQEEHWAKLQLNQLPQSTASAHFAYRTEDLLPGHLAQP